MLNNFLITPVVREKKKLAPVISTGAPTALTEEIM